MPSAVSFAYTPHSRWPLPPQPSPPPPPPTGSPVRVLVLDSSFNPPHAAHLALASRYPGQMEARLLVLGAANADKGVAAQQDIDVRLEMMTEMAKEMGQNTAVVCLKGEAARFVDKSRMLHRELEERIRKDVQDPAAPTDVRLVFPLGYDTLIRFFAPKYYNEAGETYDSAMNSFFDQDGSSIACARRGDISAEEEAAFLDSPEVKPWRQHVEMFDLDGGRVKEVSSTAIRAAVKEGRTDDVERMVPVKGVRDVVERERLYI